MMVTKWVDDRAKYQAIAARVEPVAIITTKDSVWWAVLWGCLCLLTIGLIAIKMPWRKFRDEYAQTVGPVQGYPGRWEQLSIRTIIHECRHTTQAVTLGWLVPLLGWFFGRRVRAIVGLLPMGVVYGLLPFPVFVAVGRFYLELDAEREVWRWMLDNGQSEEQVIARAEAAGRRVCGGEYLMALAGGAGLFRRSAVKIIAGRKKDGSGSFDAA